MATDHFTATETPAIEADHPDAGFRDIDRATAARLNPFISPIHSQDTRAIAADAVEDLGRIVAAVSGTDVDLSRFFRVSETVSAALRYEDMTR